MNTNDLTIRTTTSTTSAQTPNYIQPSPTQPGDLVEPTKDCYLAASPLMKKIMDAVISCIGKGTVPASFIGTLNPADQISIAVKGEAIFKQMADAVRLAESEFLLQTFTWDSKIPGLQMLNEALQDVAKRKRSQGALNPLRVYVLIDERGTLAHLGFTGKIAQKWPCTAENLNLFSDPGFVDIYPATFHHNSFRGNHAKSLIIDGKILAITGANFQASNFGHLPAHDASMIIKGLIAQAARADFVETWMCSARKEEKPSPPLAQENKLDIILQSPQGCIPMLFVSTKARQDLINTTYDSPLAVSFLEAIAHAQHKIQIATPNLNAPCIIEALADFIHRTDGTVELVLGKGFNDSREAMPGLGGTNQNAVNTLFTLINQEKIHNLKVKWFSLDGKTPVQANVAGASHLKFMAIDEQITIFGNANLDIISLTALHETNVVLDDKNLTKTMTDLVFAPAFQSAIDAAPSDSAKDITLDYLGFNGIQEKLAPVHTLKIIEIVEERGGYKTIHLQKPTQWEFQPGQYLQVRSGHFLSSLLKYPATLAIASGINEDSIQITARSSLLPWHSNHPLKRNEGDSLEITGPIGTGFPLHLINPATPLFLIGGGSGLTALKSIMHSLPNNTQARLFYSAKTQNDLIYLDSIKQWASQGHFIALTQETAEGLQQGRVTTALKNCNLPTNSLAFLCGPKELIKAAIMELLAKGLTRQQIYASLPVGAKEGGPVFRGDHPKLL